MSNTVQKLETSDVPAETYRTLLEFSPVCTVDVVFFNPEKTLTLLGKRVNNPFKDTLYTFGGRLRKNETFKEAAVRISEKETGIVLRESDLIFVNVEDEINDSSIFEGVNYHAVALYFTCIISEDTKVTLDAQHSISAWTSVTDPDLHQNIKNRISNSLRALALITII